jgi:hypothetical protein
VTGPQHYTRAQEFAAAAAARLAPDELRIVAPWEIAVGHAHAQLAAVHAQLAAVAFEFDIRATGVPELGLRDPDFGEWREAMAR